VINGPGSIFGRMHQQVVCPGVAPAPAVPYAPRVLFPLSRAQPRRTSVGHDWQGGHLPLLVGVLSSCHGSSARSVARETWQRLAPPAGSTWRSVFVMSHSCEAELAEEQQEHRDLQFFHVPEGYYSLTAKVLQFFAFAQEVSAKYTLKTDDDTFLFVDRLLEELELIQQMRSRCLYWGYDARMPAWQVYYKHDIAVPLTKWYLPFSDFKLLAGTAYMTGGAYLLSKNLLPKLSRAELPWTSHMPEDAVVGRMLDVETFAECSCSDRRFLKYVDFFQGVELFHQGITECERADISRRVLSLHGVKSASSMREIFRYATVDHASACAEAWAPAVLNSSLAAMDKTYSMWGRQIPEQARQRAFHGEDLQRDLLLRHAKVKDPWEARTRFTPLETVWSPLNLTAVKEARHRAWELLPLAFVLKSLDHQPASLGQLRTTGGVPWCVRLHWVNQVLSLMEALSEQHTLLCDLTPRSFYVNATTMDVVLGRGKLMTLVSPPERPFFASRSCFSHRQCAGCFPDNPLARSEIGCRNATSSCAGFDTYTQLKVSADMLLKEVLPAGWASHGAGSPNSREAFALEKQLSLILREAVQRERLAGGGVEAQQEVHNVVQLVQRMSYTMKTDRCVASRRQPVLEQLRKLSRSKAAQLHMQRTVSGFSFTNGARINWR